MSDGTFGFNSKMLILIPFSYVRGYHKTNKNPASGEGKANKPSR